MTRRANPYRRTRSAAALVATAGSCLIAAALAPAVLAPVADAASSSGAAGLSAPASGVAGTSTAAGPTAVSSATTVETTATTPSSSGGAAMSGPTTTSTPTATATSPTVATPTVVTPTPTSLSAVTGGAGLTSTTIAQPADETESASGNGFTVQVHSSGLTAHRLTFSGSAPTADIGQELVLQRAPVGSTGTATWVNAARGTIGTTGSFKIGWTAGQSGHFQLRAVIAGTVVASSTTSLGATATATTTTGQAAAATNVDSPALDVTIFKAADATFYGPGLWGRHTACGEILRKTTLGVANRTMKCGTEVNVYFNGHEITVPVIDRGPYVNGVDWDLTKATANAVGLTDQIGRGTIGTLTADPLATGTL